jgi:hypothetical protein
MVDVQNVFQILEVNMFKKHCYKGVRSVVVQPTYCVDSVITVQLKTIYLHSHVLFNYRCFYMFIYLLIAVFCISHITSISLNMSVH